MELGGPVGSAYAASPSDGLMLEENIYKGKTDDYGFSDALIETIDYRYVTIDGLDDPKLKAVICRSIESNQEVKTVKLNEYNAQGNTSGSLVVKIDSEREPKIISYNNSSGREQDAAALEEIRTQLKNN